MGCPINQCKRINMYVDSQGIMRANKDLVKHYDAKPLPTLIGKPERIAAINARIKEDEANLASNLEPKAGNSAIIGDIKEECEHEFEGRTCTKCGYRRPLAAGEGEAEGTIPGNNNEWEYEDDGTPGTPVE